MTWSPFLLNRILFETYSPINTLRGAVAVVSAVFGDMFPKAQHSWNSVHIYCFRLAFGQRRRKIRLSTSSRNGLTRERLEVLGLVEGDDACVARVVYV